jgi:hypothetical protein
VRFSCLQATSQALQPQQRLWSILNSNFFMVGNQVLDA